AIADRDARGLDFLDLREERLGIDDDAVADDAGDAVVEDARRQEPEDELLSVGVHRVAGVVAALVPRHDREVRRQQINDLAFALVTPLCSEHRNVHNRSILPSHVMIHLDGSSLTLEQLAAIADGAEDVALAPGAASQVDAARAVIDAKAAGDAP